MIVSSSSTREWISFFVCLYFVTSWKYLVFKSSSKNEFTHRRVQCTTLSNLDNILVFVHTLTIFLELFIMENCHYARFNFKYQLMLTKVCCTFGWLPVFSMPVSLWQINLTFLPVLINLRATKFNQVLTRLILVVRVWARAKHTLCDNQVWSFGFPAVVRNREIKGCSVPNPWPSCCP